MNFFKGVIELFSTQKYMFQLLEGLKMTLVISVFAAIIGLFIGVLVAFALITKGNGFSRILRGICKVYITVIRGTPMALQLFIMYYVIKS